MPRLVDINIRDHVRYTGDGLPGEPSNAPLPIGDPGSGVYNPTKRDIREAIGDAEADRILAEAASALAVQAMTDVQGATMYAASRDALLANTASNIPAGAVFATRAEGYAYEVVTSNAHLTTAGGVGLRVSPKSARVTPRMFGAVGDGVVDDTAAVQACWVFGAANNIPVHMEGLEYNCAGEVTTRSNLTVQGQGAVMYLTAYPATGGFIHNVVPGNEAARVQSNIRIYDLITDGSKLPAATPGTNENTNLGPEFGWGASNVRIVNCTARKIDFGYGGGTGGGGFGGEQGLDDVQFIGCVAEDCYRGARVAGIPGDHPLGAPKSATGVVFRDFTARRCGTAVLCHSIGHTGDSTTGLATFDAVFDGLMIEDCGHMPWLPVNYATYPSISPQKTGAIVLAGGHNLRFSNVRVLISTGYTAAADWRGRSGYPASGNFAGAGLSGNVGALVWGWGANVVFTDIMLDGVVDTLWDCSRAVAFGELASTAPTNTSAGQDGLVRMYFNEIRHIRNGPVQYVFDSMTGLDGARFNAFMRVSLHAALGSGFIGSGGTAGLNSLTVEYLTLAGAVQSRTAAQWLALGNAIKVGAQPHSYGGGIDLVGGYSSSGASIGATYDAGGALRMSTTTTANHAMLAFYNTNVLVGSVITNGSATAYNTTSDARLKDDPKDFDGLGIVEALRVYDHAWRAGGRGFGVFAQEAADVFPDAVTMGDTDDDWNAKGVGERIPWSVDYSKLVPVLIRAVQQLSEKVSEIDEGSSLKGQK